MDARDILKLLLDSQAKGHVIEIHNGDCDHDEADDGSDWIQVAMLGQEDITKRKAHLADLAKHRSTMEVLFAKLDAVKAQAIAEKTEFWAYVRTKYGLPSGRPIRCGDDFKIMMKPEKDAKS